MRAILLICVGFFAGFVQSEKTLPERKYLYSDPPWAYSAASDAHQLSEGLRCLDAHETCEQWASEGECKNNPDFMRESCKNACQLCDNMPLQDVKTMLEILLHGARSLYLATPNEKHTNLLKSALRAADFYHNGNTFPTPRLYLGNAADALRVLAEQLIKTEEPTPIKIVYTSTALSDRPSSALETLEGSNFRLQNEKSMPLVGFGTWQLTGIDCVSAVKEALAAGYRHIDTAQGYRNEKEIGQALQESDVVREDIFLSTKLSFEKDFGKENVRAAVMKQLEDMGTSYIDLYMLHSPHQDFQMTLQTWEELENMYDEGIIKALGVSNFNIRELQMLSNSARIKPMYVQNKMSIYHRDGENPNGEDTLTYCKENDMILMTYSLMNPWPFKISPLRDAWIEFLAQRHSVSSSQVILRWALQIGAGVIPRSKNPERIKRNLDLFNFNLKQEEMALINSLQHLVSTPWNKPVGEDSFGIKDPDWKEPFDDFLDSGESLDESAMHATIVNEAGQKLNLFWIHPDGEKMPAGDVGVDESTILKTFDGHRFEIHANGAEIRKIEMDKAADAHPKIHIKMEL